MCKTTFSIETISKLIEMDFDHYRAKYSDLKGFTDDELLKHYARNGYTEGRIIHPSSVREEFLKSLQDRKTLEIGPFFRPSLTHDSVKYLDVLDTDELIERAKSKGRPTTNVKFIDYVSRDGSLRIVDEKFDLVFSSHNLEHQPDLISHLNEAASILYRGGQYAMIVPNGRYCFDAQLPPSKISDVFNAFYEKRKVHPIGRVIEHRALTVSNNTMEHWKNTGKDQPYNAIKPDRVKAAIEEFEAAQGGYVDVHSWQFQPHTLSDILRTLIQLEIIDFSSVRCFGPVFGRNEFCLELTR